MAKTHCMKLEALKGLIKNKEYYICGIIVYKSQPQRYLNPSLWGGQVGHEYRRVFTAVGSRPCLIPE